MPKLDLFVQPFGKSMGGGVQMTPPPPLPWVNITTTEFYLYLFITNDINNQQRGNKIQTKKVIVTQNNLRVKQAGSQLLVIYKLCSTVEK